MKNNTRKMNNKQNGSGKRKRLEEVPDIESVLNSNVNIFEEGADEIIESFMDFIISLDNIEEKLTLNSVNTKNDKKKNELSKARDEITILKMNIAFKLLEAFGSKSKSTSSGKKAAAFDDDLADILSSLKI